MKQWSKAELIREAVGAGVSPSEWENTVSCYHPDGKCGVCKACFKRWMAHRLNGLEEPGYRSNPAWSEVAFAELQRARAGYYSVGRCSEILAAMGVAL